MKNLRGIFVLAVAVLTFGITFRSAGQTSLQTPADSSASILAIESATTGTRVIIDSTEVGTTPLRPFPVGPGKHLLRFVDQDSTSWYHPVIEESLEVTAHAFIHRTVRFPRLLHITTEPYGASVRSRDSIMGTTPLSIEREMAGEAVELEHDGFAPLTAPVPTESNELHAVLSPLFPAIPGSSPYLSQEESKNSMPLLVVGSATVITGAVAAYFKIKSDSFYGDYRQNGDVGTLDTVHRYDLISGISFAASQVGLMALTYLLFRH